MYGKALEIPCMRIWKLPKEKQNMRKELCENGKYFGQIKKDGFWYMFEKDSEGNCFLFSRVTSVETKHLSEKSANVPHIIDILNQRLPNGTILIGEIYYPDTGKTSKDVSKIMGSLPEKAIERQQGDYGYIHYYVHDILMYAGENLIEERWTNLSRYNYLTMVNDRHKITSCEFIELADVYINETDNQPLINSKKVKLDLFIDELIESGEEGMVLKLKDGLYYPNKKPAWNMIKFKREDEADVIYTGYDLPTKEYRGNELENWEYWQSTSDGICGQGRFYKDYINGAKLIPVTKSYAKGWIGAIRIGVIKNGNLVDLGTVSSGLTDEICEDIKTNPIAHVGKALSVKYMQAYEGALRHPVFVRWRDDLNQSDCEWDKIFN